MRNKYYLGVPPQESYPDMHAEVLKEIEKAGLKVESIVGSEIFVTGTEDQIAQYVSAMLAKCRA